MHSISQDLPVHPSLRHPLTGLPLRAVGFRRDGRIIWPIMGGAPDGGDGGGTGGDSGSGDTGGDAGSGDQGAGGTGSTAEKAGDKGKAGSEKVEDLPEWAQTLIKNTRGEAAEHRTKATAAEKKLTEQLDGIAKALGLKGDDKPDPAELAKQLEEQRTAARTSAIELAVYRKASKHQGDPDALLDSRGFLAKLADLDPSDGKFQDKVDAAIKAAVDENPKLKATQAVGSSSADHAGGPGQDRTPRKPKPLTAAVSQHYGTS